MKVGTTIYDKNGLKWVAIARDPQKQEMLIDTLEYIVIHKNKACLLDPGGIEIFPSVFSVAGREVENENIEFIFASHEDPDIISSLSLWLTFNPKIKCYISWVWGGFIPHYGCYEDSLILVPDEGMDVMLGGEAVFRLIPAHHLHASGNFHFYDPKSKILFTGDVGAALFPKSDKMPGLFVEDFSHHVQYMKVFHERWMPSNEAKDDWIDRVSKLEIEMICPQHGAIFKKEDVPRFLQWFRDLKVGKRSLQGIGDLS